MMKILVIGSDAKLGKALISELVDRGDVSVRGTTRREARDVGGLFLDLSFAPVLPAGKWDVIYMVAAITGFGPCEANPRESWRVNADAPSILALQARERQSRFIFVSSDAVEIAPGTNYGRQKAYAECNVLASGGLIARLGSVAPDRQAEAASFLADCLMFPSSGLRWWS